MRRIGNPGNHKRVRFAEHLVTVVELKELAIDDEAAVELPSKSIYKEFEVVSKTIVRPLFNIPCVVDVSAALITRSFCRITGRSSSQKSLWGESWPRLPPANLEPDTETDGDVEYEMVYEWFCDECDVSIADDDVRYECELCREYCRCRACYQAGVFGDRPHAHPLVANSRPHHITAPEFESHSISGKHTGERITVP